MLFFDAYCVPGIVLSILHMKTNLKLTKILEVSTVNPTAQRK